MTCKLSTGIRPQGYLNITRNLPLPQPLAELFYAIGPYASIITGRRFRVSAPAVPQQPHNWQQVGQNQDLAHFIQFCAMCEERYQMAKFLKVSDSTGLPLMMLSKNEDEGIGQVRLMTNEAQPSDSYLRFVHEEFYDEPPYPWEDCYLIGTEELGIQPVVERYVCSYLKRIGA